MKTVNNTSICMSATSLIQKTVIDQKIFFNTGETRSLVFRFEQLRKLRCMIEENESDIMTALSKDMGKPRAEAFTSEIGMLLEEIKYTWKHLKGWVKPKTCKTMVFHMPASSYSIPEPYGVVCIIGPWNYPFQLLISPLIGALAAGNCAILKPSELSRHSATLLEILIRKYFEPSSVAVITGGAEISSELLKQNFDYLFFTGSSKIGKKVLEAAAQNLIPCTLELGGKNPCIVDTDKNIQQTAKRIAWGKFFNAGQTCVAPDYVIVRNEITELLTEELKAAIESFYHNNKQDYARIINKQHFDRIISLFEGGSIIHGGKFERNELWIEPTIVNQVTWTDEIMKEEIFGPVLPIISYNAIEELIPILIKEQKPLALYIFSNNKKTIDMILHHVSAGTVCVNGTMSQMISFTLPFGGIGESGMGKYHGHHSFSTFSHEKAVLKKHPRIGINAVFPPYTRSVSFIKKTIRLLFKHL